jgi:hypothetical protein
VPLFYIIQKCNLNNSYIIFEDICYKVSGTYMKFHGCHVDIIDNREL